MTPEIYLDVFIIEEQYGKSKIQTPEIRQRELDEFIDVSIT